MEKGRDDMEKKLKRLVAILMAVTLIIGNLDISLVKTVFADEISNYFTIYYHEDMDSEASSIISHVEYGVTTKTLTATDLGYSRSGKLLRGWYVRRQYDGKWAYTLDGNTVIWATECPEGASLCLYKEGITVAKTVPAGRAIDFYGVWVDDYFTVKYHKDDKSEASNITTKVTYGTDTKTLTAEELGFENNGLALSGWYVYRESDGKWAYTLDGNTVIWATECPEGGYLCLYKSGTHVAKTVPAGTVVHFYGVWVENSYTIKYHKDLNSEESKYTTVVEYGTPTDTLSANELDFKKENSVLGGWYAKRESDGRWAYTSDGINVNWLSESEATSNDKLYVYNPNVNVARTVKPGETVHFYGKWISGNINVCDYGVDGTDKADDIDALNKVLEIGRDNDTPITVNIPEGTYYISKRLNIYSNTTLVLDANAKIVRLDEDQEMLQSCQGKGELLGGYDQTSNITIIGGIWDGNITDTTVMCDVLRFNHCNNITLKDCTIKGYCGRHMVVFAGANGVVVDNVTFEDAHLYTGTEPDTENYYVYNEDGSIDYENSYRVMEALHIDCITEDGTSEVPALPYDGTLCNNIVVKNCTFNNLISGIGNHALIDNRGVNFEISNNKFNNIKAICINAYNYNNVNIDSNIATNVTEFLTLRNSSGVVKNNSVEIAADEFIPNRMGMNIYQDNDAEISGNTINNSKTYGIRITNGDNIKLTDNNIDNSKTTGLFVNNSTGCVISKNDINNSGNYGVLISSSEAELNNNSINTSVSHAVMLRVGSKVKLNNNIVKLAGENGINVNDSLADICENNVENSKLVGIMLYNCQYTDNIISKVNRNTVNGSENDAIQLANSKADIEYNIISGTGNNGILLNQNSEALISDNKLTDIGYNGIFINASRGNIKNNSVDAPKNYGIVIYNSKDKEQYTIKNDVINNTITDSALESIYFTNSDVNLANNNNISGCKTNAIYAMESNVKEINNNVVINPINNGIYTYKANVSDINNNNVSGAGINGIYISTASIVKNVLNNIVKNSSNYGILVSSAETTLKNNTVDTTTKHGVVIRDKSKAVLTGNTIRGAGENGININAALADIRKNNIDASGQVGIMLYNCLYTGNDINNVVENTVTNSGNAGIKANLSSNINVENNDIDITGAAGIYMHTVDNAEVIGNDIQNSKGNGIQIYKTNIANIKDNFVTASTLHGITVNASKEVILTANDVINSGRKDINSNDASTGKASNNAVSTSGTYTYSKTDFPITDTKISIRLADIENINEQNYTGNAVEPELKITYNGTELVKDTDYQVVYDKNIEPGNAMVTIKGIGGYSSYVVKNFTIKKQIITGWQKVDGKWYYYNSLGVKQTGWQKISGKWYYLNSSGVMQTGWQKISSKWYYLNGSGVMQTGWLKKANKWYYFNGSGVMQTGWLKKDNKWYYFNGSGVMQTGWLKKANKWYYFNGSGIMQTSKWINNKGKWFYFDELGIMQTSKWIKGIYYVKEDGSMAIDEWVCGGKYYVGSDGKWIKDATK